MRLTQTAISKLDLGSKSEAVFFDDELPGFAVRIREGGSKKFVVHYRLHGVQRRETIGDARVMNIAEARLKARKLLVNVGDGKDPHAEKAKTRAAAGLVFLKVAEQYLDARKLDLRPKSHYAASFYLKTAWQPLHKLAISAIKRDVVVAHMRTIAKDRGIVSANRARSTLSAFYAWCIGEGLCEVNPVIGTNVAGEEKPRDRVLSDKELVAIWNAAPQSDYGKIVRLLMLTGQRREEIGSLRWSEIDLDAKLITLPPERVKNAAGHTIPLSDDVMAILGQCAQTHGRDFVFGESAHGFAAWSFNKVQIDNTTRLNQAWTLHDLRRTAATGMADLGVQPHVIEAVLNHVSGHKAGVAGIYNRSSYANEKRAALDTWASHIRVIVAQSLGANVSKLERKVIAK